MIPDQLKDALIKYVCSKDISNWKKQGANKDKDSRKLTLELSKSLFFFAFADLKICKSMVGSTPPLRAEAELSDCQKKNNF